MYRIGVIGDYDSICGFSALGMDIFPVDDTEQARKKLRELDNDEYGIVYITEPLIENMPDEYERFKIKTVPAVIPIPSTTGSGGFALTTIRNYVKQAVGSDIIFGDGK
ncbi:V-type ATP synthase subunit F [Christensenellaceae bacterium OttesenSCG-928-K19]|nr:V-type ATP synthase subunit F [Christensenellaceae bacterium OttesenSCG-928-K19]